MTRPEWKKRLTYVTTTRQNTTGRAASVCTNTYVAPPSSTSAATGTSTSPESGGKVMATVTSCPGRNVPLVLSTQPVTVAV